MEKGRDAIKWQRKKFIRRNEHGRQETAKILQPVHT